MKTIGSIIVISFFAFLMLFGTVLIFDQAAINTNLDTQSLNLISQYDSEFREFNDNFTTVKDANGNLVNYQTDGNSIGDEAKEFFETKDKVDQLRSTANLAFKLPNIFALSIPFVDLSDTEIYLDVLSFLLIITLFVAIIWAIFGKFWGNNP